MAIIKPGSTRRVANVAENVQFLYQWCAELSPELERWSGLELHQRIIDLRASDFGLTHASKIDNLTKHLDAYAKATDIERQELIKLKINRVLLKLLRQSKKL